MKGNSSECGQSQIGAHKSGNSIPDLSYRRKINNENCGCERVASLDELHS